MGSDVILDGLGNAWQGLHPPESASTLLFPASQLYFAPQSTQHHFASSQNSLFWIPLLQGILINRCIVQDELISSESFGQELVGGQAFKCRGHWS